MARTQTLVQLSDDLLDRLDAYRAHTGAPVRRSSARRSSATSRRTEARIDRLLVDGYTRQPPEAVWNEQAAKQMIAAEPW